MTSFTQRHRDSGTINQEIDDLVLTEAPIKVPGQRYAVIIAVAPKEDGTTQQYAKTLACNILGVFDTVEEAKDFCRRNQASGFTVFNMHIVQMNCFFPLPPPMHPTNVEFCQDILSEIFDGHKEEANMAGKIMDERIAIDKKTEKMMRNNAKKRQQAAAMRSVQSPSTADSVGVKVDSESEKQRLKDLSDHTNIARREELRRKLRNAKSRSRRKGQQLTRNKRDELRKLMIDAISRSESEQKTHSGPLKDLPSLSEVSRMTPEQKEEARKKMEAQLPDPKDTKMRCVLGKPQLTAPEGVKTVRVGQ
jgi:hypothetical protein